LDNIPDKLTTLVDISYCYFIYGETQSDIARRLGVSRAKICKIIAEAKKQGIVKIEIEDPLKIVKKLEEEIRKRFNLRKTIVIPFPYFGVSEINTKIGKAASKLIRKYLRNNDIIGISGGETLYEMVKNFDPLFLEDTTVFPLMGMASEIEESTHAAEIARVLAKKINGKLVNFAAPFLIEDAKARKLFTSNISVQNCTIAIVGIGSVSSNATFFKNGYLSPKDLEFLRSENDVGCICLQFFDINGVGNKEFNSKVIGATLNDIKKIPLVIGVAGGEERKANAIKGALAGNYIQVLITDQNTAIQLLKD